MKKLICFILVAVSVLMFTSCDGCNDAQTNAKVFELPSKTQISLYSELKLQLLDNVNDNSVTWKSTDENVLEVSEGVIFAKSKGTASVSASYKGGEQKVEFSVVDAAKTPFIDETEINLIMASSLTFSPYLYVNGIAYDNAEYSVSSQDSSIISIKDGCVLTASGIGKTTLSVNASWRGVKNIAIAEIPCVVNANEGIVPAKKSIALTQVNKTFRGQVFSNSSDLEATVFIDGKYVDDAQVVWESNNSTVAKIIDGQVEACSVGETTLVGTYTKSNGEKLQTYVALSVEYAKLDLNDDLLIGLNDTNNNIDASEYFGMGYSVEKIAVDAFNSEYNVVDDKISGKIFSEATAGEYTCRIYCKEEKIYCTATLVLADVVIYNSEDLFNAAQYLTSYIALANDIYDIGERTINITEPNQAGHRKIENGGYFTGTFNGMGHTLQGFIVNTANAGIFEAADGGAVFKNFAMTDVSFTNKGIYSGALFYRLRGACILENVYIHVSDMTKTVGSGGLVAFFYMGGINIKNCIFVVDDLGNSSNGAICGRSFRGVLSMDNTYIIADGDLCSTKPDAYNSAYGAVNAYAGYCYANEETFATVLENGAIDVSEFNKYWNFDKNVPYIGK